MGIRVDGCFEICYKRLYVAFLINTLAPPTLQTGTNLYAPSGLHFQGGFEFDQAQSPFV
jgi:hypothetical protein